MSSDPTPESLMKKSHPSSLEPEKLIKSKSKKEKLKKNDYRLSDRFGERIRARRALSNGKKREEKGEEDSSFDSVSPAKPRIHTNDNESFLSQTIPEESDVTLSTSNNINSHMPTNVILPLLPDKKEKDIRRSVPTFPSDFKTQFSSNWRLSVTSDVIAQMDQPQSFTARSCAPRARIPPPPPIRKSVSNPYPTRNPNTLQTSSSNGYIIKQLNDTNSEFTLQSSNSIAQVSSNSIAQVNIVEKDITEILSEGITKFNKNHKLGLAFLEKEGFIENTHESIASLFLKYNEKLSKLAIGEMLSGKSETDTGLLYAFLEQIDFQGDAIDTALRKFLMLFILPGESQKISRIMELFASKYNRDNPGVFPNDDATFVLSFSLIMLNTDRHKPSIAEKDKMTKEQFLKNLRGTWNGGDPPQQLLEDLYDKIAVNEIQMKTKGDPDKKGWIKGIKASAYETGNRWVCLIENELRWYKNPTLGKGDEKIQGKILLEHVQITEEKDGVVSITSMLPQNIKYSTYNEKGKESILECLKLSLICDNEQTAEIWATAIRKNVTMDVEPDFDPEKAFKKIPKIKKKKKY